jgi:isoleucyl-tRNA synthetase
MPVTETGIRDAVRQALLPLWNVWYFFSLYANADGYTARRRVDSTHLLDRYVLAKTGELVATVQQQMDSYDVSGAYASVRSYLDALTNWYVRRSRDRFWGGDHDAFDTLYTVLETLSRVVAPLAPMTTEEIWRGLTGERSVHLTDWPDAAEFPADHALVTTMDAARDVCSAALSLRKARGLRVRLPLSTLTVATPRASDLEPFAGLIADEVNVKSVVFSTDVAAYCERVLTLVPRVLGPRLGGQVQQVIKAVRAGDWSVDDGGVVVAGGVQLREGEFDLKLVAADPAQSAPLPGGEGVVVLDSTVTPELAAEGLARDLVRVVQMARRDAGLDVSDRITVVVDAPEDVASALATHAAFVAGETLADDVTTGAAPSGFAGEVGEHAEVRVIVTKA